MSEKLPPADAPTLFEDGGGLYLCRHVHLEDSTHATVWTALRQTLQDAEATCWCKGEARVVRVDVRRAALYLDCTIELERDTDPHGTVGSPRIDARQRQMVIVSGGNGGICSLALYMGLSEEASHLEVWSNMAHLTNIAQHTCQQMHVAVRCLRFEVQPSRIYTRMDVCRLL